MDPSIQRDYTFIPRQIPATKRRNGNNNNNKELKTSRDDKQPDYTRLPFPNNYTNTKDNIETTEQPDYEFYEPPDFTNSSSTNNNSINQKSQAIQPTKQPDYTFHAPQSFTNYNSTNSNSKNNTSNTPQTTDYAFRLPPVIPKFRTKIIPQPDLVWLPLPFSSLSQKNFLLL